MGRGNFWEYVRKMGWRSVHPGMRRVRASKSNYTAAHLTNNAVTGHAWRGDVRETPLQVVNSEKQAALIQSIACFKWST